MASAAAFPASASAQQAPAGLYLSGATGANIAGSIVSESGNTDFHTHAGPVGILALGYRFGNGLRAEIEGDYRSNGISGILTRRVNGSLLPLSNASGSPSTYGFMANALYDIPLGHFAIPFKPYIGGGVGYSRLDFGNVTGTEPTRFNVVGGGFYEAPTARTVGSGDAFAYQAIAGASAPVAPGLEATLEYRYFATVPAKLTSRDVPRGPLPSNVIVSSGTFTRLTARDSTVLVGLRYTFGQPRS